MFLSFALSAGSFIALLFGIQMLFAKKSNRLANVLLSFWFFSRFLEGLWHYFEVTDFTIDLPFILLFSTPIRYAAPVCGFLAIKCLIYKQNKLRPIDYLHFIPGVLSIIEICIWTFLFPLNYNQIISEIVQTQNMALVFKIGFVPASFHFWFQYIWILLYIILIWDVLFRSGLSKISQWDKTKKIIIYLALIKMSLVQLIQIFHSLSLNNILFTNHDFLDSKLIITFYLLVVASLLFYISNGPKLMYANLFFAEELLKVNTAKPKEFFNKNRIEINSIPSERDSVILLESIMLKEKFFLLPNQDLIIISLAQASNLSVHKCSRLINVTHRISFPDWVNKFRVDYFIQSYSEKCATKTIDAIALESGFSSKTTFYRVFKKQIGMMPSDYFCKN
jgi:AraC-like DNA-binding protein